MAVLNNSAFPVHNNTFVGVAVDVKPPNYGLLHCVADGTVTLTTGNDTVHTLVCLAGQDINVAGSKLVSSTMEVWVS